MAHFGTGVDKEGGWYQSYPADDFKRLFIHDGKLRNEVDIKAIIYAMGGPLPSDLESFSFKSNGTEFRVYMKCSNPDWHKPRR